MDDQRLGRHAAINRPLRGRCYDNGALTGAAGITRAAHHPNPQLRRDDIELLSSQLADGVQHATAAWAGIVSDVDDNFITRQMRWQGAVITLRPSRTTLLPLLV